MFFRRKRHDEPPRVATFRPSRASQQQENMRLRYIAVLPSVLLIGGATAGVLSADDRRDALLAYGGLLAVAGLIAAPAQVQAAIAQLVATLQGLAGNIGGDSAPGLGALQVGQLRRGQPLGANPLGNLRPGLPRQAKILQIQADRQDEAVVLAEETDVARRAFVKRLQGRQGLSPHIRSGAFKNVQQLRIFLEPEHILLAAPAGCETGDQRPLRIGPGLAGGRREKRDDLGHGNLLRMGAARRRPRKPEPHER